MPSSIQRLRILLSSPGNLRIDRKIVSEVADQINSDSGRRDGFFIEVVSWETHTRPAVGSHPQEIINEQFPQDIDVYLGLLGTYFGTPTKKYQSGTEEEFRLAYASWKETGSPEILFYFSAATASPDEIDADQLKLCKSFKEEIGGLGVKYETYYDSTQFKVSLHRHLSETLYEVLQQNSAREEDIDPQPEYREFLPNYERLILASPGIAVVDLLEKSTSFLGAHTKEMKQLTDDLSRTSSNMNKQIKRLKNAEAREQSDGIIQATTAILHVLSDYRNKLKERLPNMSSTMEQALVLAQRAINLVKSNDLHSGFDLKMLLEPLHQMKSALNRLRPMVEAASETLGGWPDYGGEFSLNVNGIIALQKDLCEYIDRTVDLMTSIEGEIGHKR